MKVFTFILILAINCPVYSHSETLQIDPKYITGKFHENFCGLGRQFITIYGSGYLSTTGSNRSGVCSELALKVTHQRKILNDKIDLPMRQDYLSHQESICQFSVQALRLNINLKDLVNSFDSLCQDNRPTIIDGNLVEIMTIEMMLSDSLN